jgi:hypothetical protein
MHKTFHESSVFEHVTAMPLGGSFHQHYCYNIKSILKCHEKCIKM